MFRLLHEVIFPKWEYLTTCEDVADLEALGESGWELVSAMEMTVMAHPNIAYRTHLYFKRRKHSGR